MTFRHSLHAKSMFSPSLIRLIFSAGRTVSAREIELKSFNPFFLGKHRAKGITIAEGPVLCFIVLSSQSLEKNDPKNMRRSVGIQARLKAGLNILSLSLSLSLSCTFVSTMVFFKCSNVFKILKNVNHDKMVL